MTGAKIRKAFIEFFAGKTHKIIPTYSLIPEDPTLLFTSAGMVPFKSYFLGLKSDLKRAASCQKCFRTTDIERVGHTARHLTFFEMLGNFAFGDYFKEESLLWGWEFLTKKLRLDEKRLYVTVYGGGKAPEDSESLKIWQKILPKERHSHIKKLGDKDNFWQMADTGPCGPCSEIYYDFTRKDTHKNCSSVGCDCDRYIEIWNHVFTEFDMQSDGSLKKLPRKNIDTGMGLERLAAAVQGKDTPFETDLFMPIIKKAESNSHLDYKNPNHKAALRIIADHIRAICFLITEGILPSNEGRGYVLRRLIRRGIRYGGRGLLGKLVESVLGIFKDEYPEIMQAGDCFDEQGTYIKNIISKEENKFLKTMGLGEFHLKELIKKSPENISGKDAFYIYETYGFPFELIKEIAAEKGLTIDETGFEKAKLDARELAQSKWSGSGKKDTFKFQALDKEIQRKTEFVGYEKLEIDTCIDALADENGKQISRMQSKQTGYLILSKTPFYAESGGQVADIGFIADYDGNMLAEVTDTQKFTEKLIFHKIIAKSTIDENDFVRAVVNTAKRKKIAQNHTATHILNAALKQVLGSQIRQAGSYVSDKGFRFDYTTDKAPTHKDLEKIMVFIKDAIKQNLKVSIEEMPLAKAKELGAVTLVGEKYSDPVRCILINSNGFVNAKERLSLELCGGTHIDGSTGEIKGVKILKDTALSSGVRRIEAVAGESMLDYLNKTAKLAEDIAGKLKIGLEQLPDRITQLLENEKKLKNEIKTLKQKLLSGSSAKINFEKISADIEFIWSKTENADMSLLRNQADGMRSKNKNAVIFLVSEADKRISFILTVGKNLEGKNFDCGLMLKEISGMVEGSAGGRKDFAQGGGNKPENFESFIAKITGIIKSFKK